MSTYTDASLIVTPNAKKAGKLYALKGADLDVVRATTATYVGSDGLIKTALANEVRFDYTNGSCPSILVEPQRTNLLLRSEEFDNASWVKTNVTVIANATTAPNGNLSADKIISTATNSNHIAFNTPSSFVSSQSYNFSYYAKSAEYTKTAIRIGGPGYSIVNRAEINLSNGTIIYQQGFTSLQVQSFGNGWYRIQGTFVSASGLSVNIQPLSDSYSVVSNNYEFLGDGTSGIFVWGAQLEQGSNATSYIQTVASTVTRNADVISKTGISDLIGQTEGVIFLDAIILLATSAGLEILSLNDGTSNNRLRIITATSQRLRFIFQLNGGIVQYDYTYGIPFTEQTRLKIAISYKSGNIAVYINGIKVNSSTNILTISNTLSVLNLGNNSGALYEAINSAQLYKTQLTDQQCISMTQL